MSTSATSQEARFIADALAAEADAVQRLAALVTARPATRPARAWRRGGSGGRRAGRLVDCTHLRAHALPPATSAAFAKREKNEVKTLTKRLKNVRPRCRRPGVCRAALSEIIQLLCAPLPSGVRRPPPPALHWDCWTLRRRPAAPNPYCCASPPQH